jgi:hypothetical protein
VFSKLDHSRLESKTGEAREHMLSQRLELTQEEANLIREQLGKRAKWLNDPLYTKIEQ